MTTTNSFLRLPLIAVKDDATGAMTLQWSPESIAMDTLHFSEAFRDDGNSTDSSGDETVAAASSPDFPDITVPKYRGVTWPERTFKAMWIREEVARLYENGDGHHSALMKNVSSIHNKVVHLYVEVVRTSTGASVFTLGGLYGKFGKGYEERKSDTRYHQAIKTHWDDIWNGHMKYFAHLWVYDD